MFDKTKENIRKRFLGTKYWRYIVSIYQLPRTLNPVYQLKRLNILRWRSNLENIQIDITYRCSLSCLNCDRAVKLAPTDKDDMTVEQIRKFVDESIKLNWRWKHIALMGGEPTCHPKIFEILDELKRYKSFYQKTSIEVSTNGFGKQVNDVLEKLPKWVYVINSSKTSCIHKFSSYNVAPVDVKGYEKKDFTKGCSITDICGLGLNKFGYYPCAAGSSVDRIFGWNTGIKDLSKVNHKALKKQLSILCRLCGHFKDNFSSKTTTKETLSDRWKKALENYKNNPPKLTPY